jgi:hypothetical protein
MVRDPNKAVLSKAQMRFLDTWVPLQQHWLKQAGVVFGATPSPRERRTLNAMIRKDVVTPDGQITDTGLNAWKNHIEKLKRKQAA